MKKGAVPKAFVLNSVLHKMQGFLPRERKFFDLFENLAGKAVEAVELLVELGVNYSELPRISEQLKELEEEADSVVHQIIQELFYDHTRVTEEKGDIRYFAHNLDNVIDGIEKAGVRLSFTQRETLPEPVSEFSPILLEASQEIRTAVGCLRDMGCEGKSLEACCIRINELENEADKINRKWLQILMTLPTEDPNELLDRLLLKEIVEILEDTMDQCEDVANILETFRLKGGI
jgi:predicted phosphate transport protein (TIGR00153 family)